MIINYCMIFLVDINYRLISISSYIFIQSCLPCDSKNINKKMPYLSSLYNLDYICLMSNEITPLRSSRCTISSSVKLCYLCIMYLFSLSKQIPYMQGSPLQSDPNANTVITVDSTIRVKIFLHAVLADDG